MIKVFKLIIFTLFFILISIPASGSQYTPEGLYDPEYLTLDNGLDVVLKKRDVTHNVAIRLAVNVGLSDFACGRKELPHFIEHLLFTGTSKHSEDELDAIIEENGGSWNAGTENEKTTYEIDIYSPKASFAIDVLYEIFTDSQMTPDNVDTSRDIIHREAGGKPSSIRQWLFKHGIGRDAYVNAVLELFPDSSVSCPSLQTADGITRDDIIETFNQFYIPNNMVLVVVGDFYREDVLNKIRSTFGLLKQTPLTAQQRKVPDYFKQGPSEVTGSFSPFVDSEAIVYLAFRTDGKLSNDIHPLYVIDEYLDTRLYNLLRVKEGLSYSPESQQVDWERYGVFLLGTDVDIEEIDKAVHYLKQEVDTLRSGTFNPDDINKSKQKILLSWVQGYESNSDIADYYVSKHHELRQHGALINHEERIERVTANDIHNVASRYFIDQQSVIIKYSPQISYRHLYILIGSLFLIAVLVVWRVYRSRH